MFLQGYVSSSSTSLQKGGSSKEEVCHENKLVHLVKHEGKYMTTKYLYSALF